jgi:hypothetical protein
VKTTVAKVLACLLCCLLTQAGALGVSGPPAINSTSIQTNGANIVLSVNASDSISFYFQWQLNGNGIPGATNSCSPGTTNISYTITNAQPFDSGNYQVVVANATASAESSIFAVLVTGDLGAPITTNDNFASSLTINNNPVFVGVTGSNSSSSLPPSDELAVIAGKPAGGLLYYNWTAGFGGGISLTTRGSSFDTLLGVYTGTDVNNLTLVAEDDDSGGFFTSLVTFNCDDGATYQIVVAGYQGETGNVVLELSPGPPLLPGPEDGSYIGPPSPVITQQPVNQIVHAGDTVTNSVTASGATGYQWFFAGTPEADATNATLVITNFQTGEVGNYFAQVSNSFGAVQSDIAAIEIAAQTNQGTAGTPTNLLVDKFGDAVDLAGVNTPTRFRPLDGGGDTAGFSLSQSFSTTGATKELGEPNHANQPGGASYWYSYTAPASGTLEFDTAGSTFNTILAVYIGPGTSFNTLTNVGAAFTTDYIDLGQPVVTVTNVVGGTKYFIAIDGFLGASGDAHLDINLGLPPNITMPPQSQTNIPGSDVTFNVSVTGTTNFFYQWQFDGTNINGATLASFATNNVTSASAGSYTVIVSNAIGTVTSAPPAALTVQSAPWIEVQPISQIAVSVQDFTNLLVAAGGVPPLFYQWYFMPDSLITNQVAGATNVTYLPASSGTFFVVVSNAFGTVTSAEALVTSQAGANGITLLIITNSQPVVAITSPANNFFTTNSNITVAGTVKGGGASLPVLAVNTNALTNATLVSVARGTINWSCSITLSPGANVITAQTINTNGTETNVSYPVTRTFIYNVTAPSPTNKALLTLQTNGQGKITGETGQARLKIGEIYNATAVPGPNWVFAYWASGTNTTNLSPLPNGAALSFDMSSNLILQANFTNNPFTNVAGIYNGLFHPPGGVSQESSGFFTAALPATGSGAYSAKLLLAGVSYPFTGRFDLSGDAQAVVAPASKTPLTVYLHLNLHPPDDQMTGAVFNSASNNGWISSLLAERAVSKSSPVKYTLIIPPGSNAPASQPGGYSYATLAGSQSGLVSLSGSLADNTAFSQSVALSKNGNIPLYASLYSKKGLLLGWLTLGTNPPAQMILGTGLAWIKTNLSKGLYADGFTNTNLTALGSLYVPPASQANNFILTNGTLTISNGGLTGALIYSNLTIAGNKLANVNAAGNPSNLLEGVITPATGIVTVTFKPTGASSDITAKGVILQDTNNASTNGAGWFIGAGQSGYFLLQQ